jgi:predicted nucleic acid-binding protein
MPHAFAADAAGVAHSPARSSCAKPARSASASLPSGCLIVADASLVVDYLLDEGERGAWANDRVAAAGRLHAPHVIDLEVVSGARNAVIRGLVSARRAEAAIADLRDLAVERYASVQLLPRIWQLRHVLSPYDAAYVALAEALSLPLVTTDGHLARSHGHRAEINAFVE